MPETLDTDLVIGFVAALLAIIGVLSTALAHKYYSDLKETLDKLEVLITKLAADLVDHVEKFHTK